MTSRSFKLHCYRTAATTVLATALWSGGAYAQVRTFNMQAEDAQRAIPEFARQAGIDILVPTDKIKSIRLPALQGAYDVREALGILLAGTGLKIATDNGRIITLRNEAKPTLNKTKFLAPDEQVAQAQPAQRAAAATAVAAAPVEEVVVTGSRVVREGYEAPTPMAVVSSETLEQNANSGLVNYLATMPAITGAASATQAGAIGHNKGVESINLRSLGANRILVLLDGQRVSPATYNNVVDVSSFPAQLMSRVDIVTGGASAVYGSDAVGGVVNFVLDRNYTGVKGEISGGITNYGDDKNYKIALSTGFGFAEGRGHILLSGSHTFQGGIRGNGGREWISDNGWQSIANPTYTPTNGQPQTLWRPNSGPSTATPGGIIVAGPLKGTAFGAGGTPYQFKYGTLVSGSVMTGGGDWRDSNLAIKYDDVDPLQKGDNLFARASYELTGNITVFGQWMWAQTYVRNMQTLMLVAGTATGTVIKIDNAYLPASTRAAMVATGQTQFGIGTWNVDYGNYYNFNTRISSRGSAGLEGKFDAFDTSWRWNAYFAYGATHIGARQNSLVTARFRQSVDAVVNPANGQIVCRSTLTTPNDGCVPWNAMGIGVNKPTAATYNWLTGGGGGGFQRGLLEQTVYAASVTGEPFSLWAGPVSVAVSAEHRKDEDNIAVDPYSLNASFLLGNYASLVGAQSVTEGALETVVPLAKGESWAQNWDLNAAVRFTGYELAGYVTTWKLGTTYTPMDDIKVRLTRSRDIRAPSLFDLFATAQLTLTSGAIDRSNNTVVSGTVITATLGNPTLTPEKADTTGIGVVFSPTFINGFTVSVDYWDVNIKGAIQQISLQQTIDLCYTTQPGLCANIIRDSTGAIARVNSIPFNLARQNVRGIDLESSYSLPLSNIVTNWRGDFSLHGNMTFYLHNITDTTFLAPSDSAGSLTMPNWKLSATATYKLDPVTVSLTGRAFSAGTFNNSNLVCTSGCPASTADHPTIEYNYVPGRFYLDANVDYKVDIGDTAQADLFLSVRNLFNADMPPIPSISIVNFANSASPYDTFGAVYRVGVRFKM